MLDSLSLATSCPAGTLDACVFDRSLTPASAAFEVVVFLGVALLYSWRERIPMFRQRALLVMVAVFMFELFTAPLWHNLHLGRFAYVYRDVSWVLTLGWTALIMAGMLAVDTLWKRVPERRRFFGYLLFLTPAVALAEIAVRAIGVRGYSPEVMASISGVFLPAGVPVELLYYVPVFLTLTIAFSRYVTFGLERLPVIPVRRWRLLKRLLLAVTGVFFFELLVEPMVANVGFPSWTYVYKDISLAVTGVWVLIVWVSTMLVDRFVPQWNLIWKLGGYLAVSAALMVPFEAYQIVNGYRVYGESAMKNFSGVLAFGSIPIEVLFAVPCYLLLVICFVRYWMLVTGDLIERP